METTVQPPLSEGEGVITPSTPTVKPPFQRQKIKKRKGGTSNMYFHAGTQAAIVSYQKTPCLKEKSSIYVSDIMPAFEKLAENLINIHKFSSLFDSYDDLKNDCVNFLFETLYKFDATRGTNAFSYFNIVAKHWLIIRTKQKANRIKKNVSMDDSTALTNAELKMIEDHATLPSQDDIIESQNQSQNIKEVLYDIRSRMKTENELACINSIITIFENIDDIDLVNKGSTLLYMREISGLTPKQLTTTLQIVKKAYRKVKSEKK